MLRIAPGMKFQASRNLVRTPLKHFPKPFKANQRSSFYYTLTSSPKLSIPKAVKHGSQDSEEPLPDQKASSKGFLQKIASLFPVGKPAPGTLQRSRSGRHVLIRLASKHECTKEEENQFMEIIDRVDLDELERLIPRMQESTRIEEAIQKIGNQADMLRDQAYRLELLIVELLIYKGDYDGDYDEAYKKVLQVVAKAPEDDQTPHVLLHVVYQKEREVKEPQQGEASKGH